MALEKILKQAKQFGKKVLIGGLFASFPLYFGCTEKEYIEGDKDTPKDENVYENTFVMKDEFLNKISSVGDVTLSFSEPIKDEYGLNSGDILVGGISSKTPYGILKEIIGFSQDNKTILTKNASLEDAIKYGAIEYNQSINFSGLESSSSSIKGSKLVKGSSGNYDFHLNFDKTLLFDLDGDTLTTSDQVLLNGDISFSIKPNMKFVFNDGLVSSSFGINLPGEFYLNIESSAGDIMLEGEKKIFSARATPIIVSVSPVPIVIFPKIELYLGAKGGMETDFNVGIQDVFKEDVNITYTASSNGWVCNQDFSNSFQVIKPSLEPNFSAKVYVSPRLVFMVDGILGPYVEGEGYVRGEVNVLSNPWWSIYGGLEAKLGLDMNFLSKFVPDFEKKFYSVEEKIVDAGGPLIPATTDTLSTEGEVKEVIIQPGPEEGKDAWVERNVFCNHDNIYANSGSDSIMEIVYDVNDCSGIQKSALIEFPLDAIPANAEISSAKLEFYGWGTVNAQNQVPTFLLCKQINSWEESSVTWETKPYREKVCNIEIDKFSVNSWYSVDVTPKVQDWVNGKSNYGFEISTSENGVYGAIRSSDHPQADKRPKLVIKYFVK